MLENPALMDIKVPVVRNLHITHTVPIGVLVRHSMVLLKLVPFPSQERQTQMIRGTSVSSVNDQVIESSQNQKKVSIQSSEEVISEQNIQKVSSVQSIEQRRSSSSSGPEQLDARYFGELLAELSRKNNDLYGCLMTHVEKIGARKPSDSEYQVSPRAAPDNG
ncbi:unnamed protein product [Ranitomeya imitator]|uniref:POF1B helix-loop-helix domain-containing protein n=1 Tax=Ranitomeya imitator TaxID=111125 RepID=A0ABN9LMI4_9NEOB|nr:unnamed protein product [Ranitomeya imitator]